MNYPQAILNSLIILLTFFILRHYFIFYWCSMFDIPKVWNSKIEKPRLALLSLFYPITCISAWILIDSTITEDFFSLKIIVTILLFALFFTMSLIVILTPLLKFTKKVRNLSREIFQEKFQSVFISLPEKENEFFEQFNNDYFFTTKDNFHSFIHCLPLKQDERIIWLYSLGMRKNKNGSNLQALFHFISEIFSTQNKDFIEQVVKDYFQDEGGQSLSSRIQPSTYGNWKERSPVHLEKMSEKIKYLINNR